MKKNILINRIGLFAFWGIILLFFGLATWANTDLIAGRFVLFGDEKDMTFDPVYNLLHPKDLASFVFALTNGGYQIYGRIVVNISALFSYVPEKIWGEPGQIVATRMTQVLLLLSAYVLLCFTFVKKWALRALFLLVLCTIPFTSYYMSMPKPEPIQMLTIALFLHFWFKQEGRFGWYFLFLGMAFGAKISALPVILVFGITSLWLARNDLKRIWADDLIIALCWGLLGWGLAVPILFKLTAYASMGLLGIRVLWQSKIKHKGLYLILFLPLIFSLVYSQYPVFKGRYLPDTFLFINNPWDDPSITFNSWKSFVLNSWFALSKPCPKVFLSVIGLLSGFLIFQSIENKSKRVILLQAIGFAGLALNLLIMFKTKRLWGFYLYPGTVLCVTGFFGLYDMNKKSLYWTLRLVTIVSFVILAGFWFKASFNNYKSLATRTKTTDYQNNYQSYLAIMQFLQESSQEVKIKRVHINNFIFTPFNLSGYKFSYPVLVFFDNSPDIIIMQSYNIYLNYWKPALGSLDYQSWSKTLDDYKRLVVDKGQKSDLPQYYERVQTLPNGYEILVLRKKDSSNAQK